MNRTKTATRVLSILAARLLLLASLTACSGGITREETQTAMDSLLSALDNENYAEAAALYHPDAAMSEDLLAAFAEQVKLALHVPALSVADAHRPVHRVAVLGGSGSDEVAAAVSAGADACLSGNLKCNQMVDTPDEGINLIEAGHFYTEQPICYHLADMLRELDGEIETRVTWSCRIRTV